MPHDHAQFVVGERIQGTKYVLCSVLGKGGMGVVYEVVKEPGIRGAMKVMYPSMVTRPDCVARFFDEVRLLAKLRHKNIVAVYDFDRLEDGTPFLVMEKLEGETLRSTLRKSARSTQGFPARGAYEVTRQTCEGLYRAHTQPAPVVHRDIKPENLFLNQLPGVDEVEVKVLDFGVAALVDGGKARGQFGTPKYMAPEQFRGEPATPSSDLYAVALVLYEMLTGRLPWDARRDHDLYQAHMFEEPVPASRFAPWIPRSIDALIASALDRDPNKRPHSVFAFASQLYELQWVDDGHSRAVDVNTTAPTLTALVSAFAEEAREPGGSVGGHDTFRGGTPPPVEGASPEFISFEDTQLPREAIAVGSPQFSSETTARGMAESAKAIASTPSIDRYAPTPEQLQSTRPVPKNDTEPLSMPRPARHAADTAISTRPAATPLAATVGSLSLRSRKPDLRGRAQTFLPMAVFIAIVSVGTAASVAVTRRSSEVTAAPATEHPLMPAAAVSAPPASVATVETRRPDLSHTDPGAVTDLTDASAVLSEANRSLSRTLVGTPQASEGTTDPRRHAANDRAVEP